MPNSEKFESPFLNFSAEIRIIAFAFYADVAELVDAQVSEACGRKLVEVRFFSSAFSFNVIFYQLFSNLQPLPL